MAEELAEEERAARGKRKRTYDLNLDPEYWTKRFLFPYALDLAPLKLPPPSLMDTFDFESSAAANASIISSGPKPSTYKVNVLDTKTLQFPIEYIMKKI
jgi:hypothetical protein